MRRISFFTILFMILVLSPLPCFASSNTFTRTPQNPLVPKDVVVSKDNLNDILNTPAVSSDEKIYDFADLFTNQDEDKIFQEIDQYSKRTDLELLIVTTKDLRGFTLKQYANNFYNYNDFKINGMVFLIFMNEAEPEIYMANIGDSTGKQFSVYTNVRIGQILKYVYKDIKIGNYYTATMDYIKLLNGFYDIERAGDYEVDEEGKIIIQLPWVEMVILGLSITFIVIVLLLLQIQKNNRINYKDDLNSKMNEATMRVKIIADEFITTTISKRRK